MLTLGSTQQCSFSDDVGNKGTVYVADKKIRGDFSTTVENNTTNGHMIVNENTAYLWIDGQTTGYEMSMDVVNKAAGTNINTASQIDLDKKIDYDCKSWNVDASVFILPTDIKFTDLSKLISPAGSGIDKAKQCSACDQVPESAKAQCKTALGCN